MPSPVTIGFAVKGLSEVQRAFGSVQASMVRMEVAGGQAAVKGASERVKTSETERKAREAEYAAFSRYLTKSEEAGVKAAKAAATEKERIAETSIRKMERELEASERRKTAIVERELVAQEQAASTVRKRIASASSSAVMNGTGRAFGAIGSMAGAALTIGGGFAIADAVRGQFAAEKSAQQILNLATVGNGGQVPAGTTLKSIMAGASAAAIQTGMSKDEVLQGALSYAKGAKGGDIGGVMGNMGFLAKLSKTSGTSMSDLGAGMGVIQSQNPNATTEERQQLLLNAYAQAGAGSMSLVDAAKQLGTMGSTRGFYQGDAGKNQRTLFALGQLAVPGGTAAEAGTYIKDVGAEAMRHKKDLVSFGVKFDKYGAMSSPEDMLAKAIGGTGGDLGKLEKIFGLRGMPLITQLQGGYVEASKKAGGGAAGRAAGEAAVRANIAGVASATMTGADLDKMFSSQMSSPAERFGVAMNRVTEIIQEKGAPYLERFADKLPAIVDRFSTIVDAGGKLASFLVDNPIKGVGALILASVTKDLAGMALGVAVKSMILSMMNGGAAGGGLKGALGAAGGTRMGGAIGVVGAATAGVAIGVGISDYLLDKQQGSRDKALSGAIDAGNLATKRGRLTPADIAERQAKIAQLEEQKRSIGSVGGHALAGVLSAFGSDVGANVKADEAARSKLLQESIDQLKKSIDQNTAATAADTKTAKLGGSTNDPARNTGMGDRAPKGGAKT